MYMHTRKYGSQRASATKTLHVDETEYSAQLIFRTFVNYQTVKTDDMYMVITPTTEEEWKKLMSVVHRGYRLFAEQQGRNK